MHDFGDELSLHIYRVPWLIRIQVIVMVLLVLLYCFSLLVMDLPEYSNSRNIFKASSSSSSRLVSSHSLFTSFVSANRLQHTPVGESLKGEIVASTSRVMRAEDMVEMTDSAPNIYLHPCYYFRLARVAFLKCLGLDPNSENSPTPQRGKRKES